MEKLTITRALAELKLLDKRIEKTINESNFITYSVNQKLAVSTFTPKESLQSVTDLIERRALLKAAIMKSNATTKVTIGKKEMLVIEAIETKQTISYKQSLLQKLKMQQQSVKFEVSKLNEKTQERLDKLLEANFGKDSKTKSDETDAIVKPFLDRNEPRLEDPLAIDSVIQELSDEILDFMSNVDYALSESNALTQIEI